MLQVVRYCLVYIYVLYFQIIQLPVVLWFFQHSSSLLSISHKNPSFRIIYNYASRKLRNPCPFYETFHVSLRIIYASRKLRNPCPFYETFYETLSVQSYFQWMLLYIHFLHGSILRLLFQIQNNTSGELYNSSTRSLNVSKNSLDKTNIFPWSIHWSYLWFQYNRTKTFSGKKIIKKTVIRSIHLGKQLRASE